MTGASDNVDRLIRDLESTLNNSSWMDQANQARREVTRLRTALDISRLPQDERLAYETIADQIRDDVTHDREFSLFGATVTREHLTRASTHACQHHMSLYTAVVEVMRSYVEGLRYNAEVERRRQRMEQARTRATPTPNPPVHPVFVPMRAAVGGRGYAFNSHEIIRTLHDPERYNVAVQQFVDGVCEICRSVGNLQSLPTYDTIQFSANFTPRPDTPHRVVTLNVIEPVSLKLVCWQEVTTDMELIWHVRRNHVNSDPTAVSLSQVMDLKSATPQIHEIEGNPYEADVGRESRSIMLD